MGDLKFLRIFLKFDHYFYFTLNASKANFFSCSEFGFAFVHLRTLPYAALLDVGMLSLWCFNAALTCAYLSHAINVPSQKGKKCQASMCVVGS